jgi:hypothetical protein
LTERFGGNGGPARNDVSATTAIGVSRMVGPGEGGKGALGLARELAERNRAAGIDRAMAGVLADHLRGYASNPANLGGVAAGSDREAARNGSAGVDYEAASAATAAWMRSIGVDPDAFEGGQRRRADSTAPVTDAHAGGGFADKMAEAWAADRARRFGSGIIPDDGTA